MSDATPLGTGTQSLERAISILSSIAHAEPGAGASLTEIAAELKLSKSTTKRILATLEKSNFLFRDARTKHYKLGLGLVGLGFIASRHVNLPSICETSLRRLAEETGDAVYLLARRGNDAICLDEYFGQFPIRAWSHSVSTRQPLVSGAGGIVMLASLPQDEMDAIIAEAPDPLLSIMPNYTKADLHEAIANIRRLGYHFYDGRYLRGIREISVALLDPAGHTLGALAILAIEARLEGDRIAEVAALLKREKQVIEARLANLRPSASAL